MSSPRGRAGRGAGPPKPVTRPWDDRRTRDTAGRQAGIRRSRMSDKRGDGASKVIGAAAAFAAAVVARKVITVGWKRLTGKEPPSDPPDPHVGTGEALGFAIVIGVALRVALLLPTPA